jgi:hypothetical protein
MRIVFSSLLLLLHLAHAHTQIVNFQTSNLPIVLINTNGQYIVDEPKITATMKIIDNGPDQINHVTDTPNGYDDHIGIEIRGATSQQYEKKPYSIELRDAAGEDVDVPLLGMPKEHDWVLIAPLNDKTLLRDWFAYQLGNQSMDWAPRTRHVEVAINGKYEGVYMLVEHIKRDKNRVNIAKMDSSATTGEALTGGYLLAFDKTNGGGFGGDWKLPHPPASGAWQETWAQIRYPKSDDILPEQFNYIKNYINSFDNAMYQWTPNQPGDPVYEQWIDVDSWVNYLLINEVTKNIDAYRLSAYFYKDNDSDGGKIHMGPIWDFNITSGIGDYCQGNSFTGWVKDFNQYCGTDTWIIHFWWNKLCHDYAFKQKVKQRWQTMRSGIWSNQNLTHMIDSMATVLNEPQKRNFQRWQVLGQYVWPNAVVFGTYTEELNYFKNFVINRAVWMDGHIDGVGPSAVREVAGIEGPVMMFPNPVQNVLQLEYDLQPNVDLSIRAFDMQGRLAQEFLHLPVGRPMHNNIEINHLLPSGTYEFQVLVDGKIVQTSKVIVQ